MNLNDIIIGKVDLKKLLYSGDTVFKNFKHIFDFPHVICKFP